MVERKPYGCFTCALVDSDSLFNVLLVIGLAVAIGLTIIDVIRRTYCAICAGLAYGRARARAVPFAA